MDFALLTRISNRLDKNATSMTHSFFQRATLLATLCLLWPSTPLHAASPAFNYLPSPVDVTPAVAGAWADVDVSGLVRPGATGVLVLFLNPTGTDHDYGIRMNGSTDPWDAVTRARSLEQGWLMTGLDTGRTFEVYTASTAVKTYLLAYTMEGVTFFKNRIQKTIAFTGGWRDVDISAETGGDTAIGGIFTVVNKGGSSVQFGLRMNGSTDNRVRELRGRAATLGLVGSDGAEIAELQVETTDIDLYLVGYVTHGAVFFTNGINKSTATTNTYVDVDISADITSRANGAFVELYNSDSGRYQVALRENGATDDFYLSHQHGFASVGIDSNHIFEQKIENNAMDLYLLGYSLAPFTQYRSIGTAPDYNTGTVSALSGSPVVTGSGVSWLSANRGQGDRIQIDFLSYTIFSVDSETQLTLTTPFTGTSGAGKTYVISRQYATLQSWEDCIDNTTPCAFFPGSVTDPSLIVDDRDEVGLAYNDSVFTSRVEIKDSVTDATHRIVLTAAPGNRHVGFAGTGVELANSANNEPAILIEDDFVTVEGFEIHGGTGNAEGFRLDNFSDGNHIVLRGNIIHDVPEDGIKIKNNKVILDFFNNIVYRAARSGIRFDSKPVQARFFNNTVYGCLDSGFEKDVDPTTVLKNNLAHSNSPSDFNTGSIDPASSNNIAGDATGITHSPGGGGLDNVLLEDLLFFSTTPGLEDFHIYSGSVAQNNAVVVDGLFGEDIDRGPRSAPWDVGADEAGSPGGSPQMSSSGAQSFTVGATPQGALTITILDDPVISTITAVNDIRIRIPAGFHMRWDDSVTTVALGGPAAPSVDTSVKAYEDFGLTVVLDVQTSFVPGDQLTITGLVFKSFTAPSPLDRLELEVGNDDLISAFDSATIRIAANGAVHLSSDADQWFTVGAPATPAATLFITDATPTPFISVPFDIRIVIPPGLNMDWDNTVGSVLVSGTAMGRVDPTPVYETAKTVRFNVTSNFLAGEWISIAGLQFRNFIGPSTATPLQLDVGSAGGSDDKLMTILVAKDVPVFTATATDTHVQLEWVAPAAGDCAFLRVRARDDGAQPAIGDRVVGDFPCTLGSKGTVGDPGRTNGNLYHYGIFVEDSAAGVTPGKFVKARPFAVGTIRWAYSTGATSLAPPGLRLASPDSFVYAVSNDSILHSMVGGPAGGGWPGPWFPFVLGAPAQARPPVVGFPVGVPALEPAAFLGSQDGKVYAVNAVSGASTWDRSIATMVQAAPAGHFDAYQAGAHDVVITGTRNGSGANALEALDVHDGMPAWTFDNSGAHGGTGKDIGIISGSAMIDYPNARAYFASRKGTGGNPSPDTLWCVSFTAGAPTYQWSVDIGNIDGSPMLEAGVLYVGNNTGRLFAIDPANGSVHWSRDLGDGAIKGFVFPEFGAGNVFVSTAKNVWSIADNGFSSTINWNVPESTILGPSTPTYLPGTNRVLVGSADGKLYQIDISSPATPTSVILGSGTAAVGPPTKDNIHDMVYAGTEDGVIYAIQLPIP